MQSVRITCSQTCPNIERYGGLIYCLVFRLACSQPLQLEFRQIRLVMLVWRRYRPDGASGASVYHHSPFPTHRVQSVGRGSRRIFYVRSSMVEQTALIRLIRVQVLSGVPRSRRHHAGVR